MSIRPPAASGSSPPTCPRASSAPPPLRVSAPHLHLRALRGKGKGQNRAGGVPRIFRDTLETVCIYLQQINNKDLLGPEEENQFTSSEVALPACSPLGAAIGLLQPSGSLSLPGFPTSSPPLSVLKPLVCAKPHVCCSAFNSQ